MEKKRFRPNLFFLVAILAVVFLAYYARQKNTDTATFKIKSQLPKQAARSIALDDAESGGTNDKVAMIEEAADLVNNDLEPLQKWISGEAVSLSRTSIDLEERDREITEKVKNFGTLQLRALQEIAQNNAAPMNERILSTYMLGKVASSRQNLIDLASSETSQKDFKPHSEGEIRATEERSLKIMQVDEIAQRTDTLENRLYDLDQVMRKTNDQLIKEYALKKTNELKK